MSPRTGHGPVSPQCPLVVPNVPMNPFVPLVSPHALQCHPAPAGVPLLSPKCPLLSPMCPPVPPSVPLCLPVSSLVFSGASQQILWCPAHVSPRAPHCHPSTPQGPSYACQCPMSPSVSQCSPVSPYPPCPPCPPMSPSVSTVLPQCPPVSPQGPPVVPPWLPRVPYVSAWCP